VVTGRWLALGVFALGLLGGGIGGSVRYKQVDDPRVLCASCHHGAVDLEKLDVKPPHSTDFNANCHGCHVLPVKQYLQYTFSRVGLHPAFVDTMSNPIIGGQTCLECHLARGRGVIACEQCHTQGTLQVRLDERCPACHTDKTPLYPHSKPACRDCHAEVYLDAHGRVAKLMAAKLGDANTRSDP
jgi:hypothetical protein